MPSPVFNSFSNLQSGDVLLMDRRCLSMRDPMGIAFCLLHKTECKYDHVAMIMKLSEKEVEEQRQKGIINLKDSISPSGTYVLETNFNGVTLRTLENRLERSSAKEIAVRLLHMETKNTNYEKEIFNQLEKIYKYPYKQNLLGFLPSFISTPDKMDRVKAAHKIYLLDKELKDIDKILSIEQSKENIEKLKNLKEIYINATIFLQDLYFPHLKRIHNNNNNNNIPSLDWSNGHFKIDGNNTEETLFCSELIIRIWQESGILIGFPPASSFRPFDFLDNSRFNFLNNLIYLGNIIPLTGKNSTLVPVRESNINKSKDISDCIKFYHLISNGNDINLINEKGLKPLYKWLIQSNTNKEVNNDLIFNIISTGVLFTLCNLISAPLRLRWIESQLGVFLMRGSVWSLSVGFFARDLLCTFIQALTICFTLSYFLQSKNNNNNNNNTSLLGPSLFNSSIYFDIRHPYYNICCMWLISNALAHIITTPLLNSVLAHHFAPIIPRSWPLYKLMRGYLLLLPIGILLPFQAAWVTWYETIGSAIIPTSSSILRRRKDMIESDEWGHFKYKALTGAFIATTIIDIIAYPLQTKCWRSLLIQLYKPATSPSYGRRLYAGYRFRFAGNIITMFTTAASLKFLGVC